MYLDFRRKGKGKKEKNADMISVRKLLSTEHAFNT